jgi:hypothetical protein
MMLLWAKLKERNERRRQKHLVWWSRERTKGRLRFHLWFTFKFVVLILGAMSLSDLLFDHRVQLEMLPLKAFAYTVTGLIFSFIAWSDSESKYRHSLANKDLASSSW